MNITLLILSVVITLILTTALQRFLSKKERKLLGFILPIISFILSLIQLLSIAVAPSVGTMELAMVMGSVLIYGNIPTAILLIIYFVCREGIKKKKQLAKMKIEDLE